MGKLTSRLGSYSLCSGCARQAVRTSQGTRSITDSGTHVVLGELHVVILVSLK